MRRERTLHRTSKNTYTQTRRGGRLGFIHPLLHTTTSPKEKKSRLSEVSRAPSKKERYDANRDERGEKRKGGWAAVGELHSSESGEERKPRESLRRSHPRIVLAKKKEKKGPFTLTTAHARARKKEEKNVLFRERVEAKKRGEILLHRPCKKGTSPEAKGLSLARALCFVNGGRGKKRRPDLSGATVAQGGKKLDRDRPEGRKKRKGKGKNYSLSS